MRDKLLLIDAYSIICRGFYALPLLSNSKGLHTNAVLGFLNILYKTIDDEKPKYIAVAFDENKQTFRHKLYPEYKANRGPMPEELKEQVPYVKQILEASNIKMFSQAGFEADDILGTLAYKFADDKLEAVILSGDKDMLQLPTKNIKIRLVKTVKSDSNVYEYYDKDVEAEYNMTPTEFIDLKAIMGDPSDNIKGLKGIGKITANELIVKYKSIENIHDHIDEITKATVKKAFTEQMDDARFFKTLVTIKKDVPLEANLSELEINNLFNDKVFNLIQKFELKSQYKRFNKKNATKDIKNDDELENPFEEEDLPTKIQNEVGIDDKYKNVLDQDVVIAKENEDFDIKINKNDNLGIYCDIANVAGNIKYIIALTTEKQTKIYIGKEYSKDILELAESHKVYFINLKEQLKYFDKDLSFDKRYIQKDQLIFNDLSIMSYLIDPNKKNKTYDELAKSYLNIDLSNKKDLFGKYNIDNLIYSNTEIEEGLLRYLSFNSKMAYILSNELSKLLTDDKLLKLYNEVEMPLLYVLYNMEKIGIEIDSKYLSKYDKKLDVLIEKLTNDILTLAGSNFNINSPKQLQKVLFEDLKLEYDMKKGEKLSTSIEVLEKLRDKHPIVEKIINYRTISKLSSTYAKALPTFIADDGRIHTNFNQTETATGRLSSDNPNLQNIPVRTELGKELRKVFVPREGYCFVDADYSQIELRVLAIISGDQKLIDAYIGESDVHTITASQVFNVPVDKVTKDMRRNAKAVNFGIIYGMSAFGLGEDLHIDQKTAREYINKYFETYKDVKIYLDNVVANAEKNGYVKTYFGRIRYINEFKHGNGMQKAFAKRVAMNSPIQGTASDIIKMAMVAVEKQLIKQKVESRILLQVHDEILIECKKTEEDIVKKILTDCMQKAFDFKVELAINIEIGNNFEEVH